MWDVFLLALDQDSHRAGNVVPDKWLERMIDMYWQCIMALKLLAYCTLYNKHHQSLAVCGIKPQVIMAYPHYKITMSSHILWGTFVLSRMSSTYVNGPQTNQSGE
jgi:hypothetical protein